MSFFDFVVMSNHLPLRRVDNTFIDLIREFEDRPLTLQIYNSKSQTLRGKSMKDYSVYINHAHKKGRPPKAHVFLTFVLRQHPV